MPTVPRRPVVPPLAAVLAGAVMAASTAAASGPAAPAAVPGDADFAAALYGRVAATNRGNVFLSPASVRTALAMTATGAAGATAGQMVHALALPAGSSAERIGAAFAAARRPTPEGCRLDVADAVWVQTGAPFRPAFTAGLADDFGAQARTADFAAAPEAARVAINDWVAGRTRQKITDLLPPGSVQAGTGLVLVDAVHFHGNWADPFQPDRTTDAPFHLDAGHDVSVRMMRSVTGSMPVLESDAASIVELPYRGGELSMVLVIPRAIDGLTAVEKGLTGDVIRDWFAGLRPTEAYLELPRFTAHTRYTLNRDLVAMGMADAFDRGRADFSGMIDPASTGVRLFIGDVFHQAFVAVDEQGTEAAAATGVRMAPTLARRLREAARLTADRPFLYLVRDRRTGSVLFIGRCADPRA